MKRHAGSIVAAGRNVDVRHGGLVEERVAHWRSDADDFHRLAIVARAGFAVAPADPDHLADRIALGEQPPRQQFVDDGHAWHIG